MTLSELVTNLATSQQLREAGFPQDTALVWIRDDDDQHVSVVERSRTEEQLDLKGEVTVLCAAPTAGELEEWLRTKYPDATISSFRRGDFGMDADIDDDALNYHNGVGMYPTHIAALAALVLEVAG